MPAADHLIVPRQHGLFLHHGIDLGDGSVAHYLEGREILRSPIEEFSCGKTVTVLHHQKSSSKSTTLRRAISRLGEQNYNLLFNNCEHFANWCKTGLHRSKQMENFLGRSSFGAIAIGQFIPAALLTALGLLIKNGLVDEAAKEKANALVQELDVSKKKLLKQLETHLEKIDDWIKSATKKNQKESYRSNESKLLICGQIIADKVTEIEELEEQINSLFRRDLDQV